MVVVCLGERILDVSLASGGLLVGLPGGKVVESLSGGDSALSEAIKRLKAEEFEGYLRTNISYEDENVWEGYIIFIWDQPL